MKEMVSDVSIPQMVQLQVTFLFDSTVFAVVSIPQMVQLQVLRMHTTEPQAQTVSIPQMVQLQVEAKNGIEANQKKFQSHKWYNYKFRKLYNALLFNEVSIPQMVQLQGLVFNNSTGSETVVSIPQMVQLQVPEGKDSQTLDEVSIPQMVQLQELYSALWSMYWKSFNPTNGTITSHKTHRVNLHRH